MGSFFRGAGAVIGATFNAAAAVIRGVASVIGWTFRNLGRIIAVAIAAALVGVGYWATQHPKEAEKKASDLADDASKAIENGRDGIDELAGRNITPEADAVIIRDAGPKGKSCEFVDANGANVSRVRAGTRIEVFADTKYDEGKMLIHVEKDLATGKIEMDNGRKPEKIRQTEGLQSNPTEWTVDDAAEPGATHLNGVICGTEKTIADYTAGKGLPDDGPFLEISPL